MYIPGPTTGLILVVCIFYPLNTNAIKFIIIEFINTTDKVNIMRLMCNSEWIVQNKSHKML